METESTRMCDLLVGLPNVNIEGVGEWPRWLRIATTRRSDRPTCHGRGGRSWRHDDLDVELVDLPCFGRRTRLVWTKARWRCPNPRVGWSRSLRLMIPSLLNAPGSPIGRAVGDVGSVGPVSVGARHDAAKREAPPGDPRPATRNAKSETPRTRKKSCGRSRRSTTRSWLSSPSPSSASISKTSPARDPAPRTHHQEMTAEQLVRLRS